MYLAGDPETHIHVRPRIGLPKLVGSSRQQLSYLNDGAANVEHRGL